MKLLPIVPRTPRDTDERLGFFDRDGRRICSHCYFRLSTSDSYVRVRLTRIVPSYGLQDIWVSSIWTGTDPHAIEEKRGPLPFLTAVYTADRDTEPVVIRSAALRVAHTTHDAAVKSLCRESTGTPFDVEIGKRPSYTSAVGDRVGVC